MVRGRGFCRWLASVPRVPGCCCDPDDVEPLVDRLLPDTCCSEGLSSYANGGDAWDGNALRVAWTVSDARMGLGLSGLESAYGLVTGFVTGFAAVV